MTGKPQQRNRACVISTFQVAEINGFQGRLSPNVATPRDPGDLAPFADSPHGVVVQRVHFSVLGDVSDVFAFGGNVAESIRYQG